MDSVDLEVLKHSAEWIEGGRRVLLVTVVKTWGSSPRPEGAMLAVRDDGHVVGSVSGGCIDVHRDWLGEPDRGGRVRAGGGVGDGAHGDHRSDHADRAECDDADPGEWTHAPACLSRPRGRTGHDL